MPVLAIVVSLVTVVAVFDRGGAFGAPYPTFKGPILSTVAIAAVYLLDLQFLGVVWASVFVVLGAASVFNLPLELYSRITDPPDLTGWSPSGRAARRRHQDALTWAAEHADELDAHEEWLKGGCIGPDPWDVIDAEEAAARNKPAHSA